MWHQLSICSRTMPGVCVEPAVEEIEGAEVDEPADLVIKALGFEPEDLPTLWGQEELQVTRWGTIKARFSRDVRRREAAVAAAGRSGDPLPEAARLRQQRSPSKVTKQDAGIWQRRFWEHHIRSPADHAAHLRYCWFNPVKHGLVERPEDWAFSSVHRDIAWGRYATLDVFPTCDRGWVETPPYGSEPRS